MVCASVHVWTSYRCIYFHMSNFLYPRWKKCPSAFIESDATTIVGNYRKWFKLNICSCVTIYWWRHILCSFVQFLEVSLFRRLSSDLLVTIAAIAMGFYYANLLTSPGYVCRMLFSRLNVIASSWIVFVAGYCPAHLSQDYLHIYWSWAIRLYLFQLQLYRMLPSVVWF